MPTPDLDSPGVSLPSDADVRPTAIDWRWALPRIAAVFVVSRLLVLAVAVAVEVAQPVPPGAVRSTTAPSSVSLTLWDTEHYVGIAADGYDAEVETFPEYAFYPGFPLVMRAASLVTLGDLALAGVLAANIAFALALVALYALSLRYQAPRSRHPEPLVPGPGAAQLRVRDGLLGQPLPPPGGRAPSWPRRLATHGLAGALVALSAVTRAPGILLCLPLFVLIAQRDGVRSVRSWLPLLLAPLALAAFFGYLWWLTGDPLAAVHAQEHWNLPSRTRGGPGPCAAERRARCQRSRGRRPPAVVAYWIGALALLRLPVRVLPPRPHPTGLLARGRAGRGQRLPGGLPAVRPALHRHRPGRSRGSSPTAGRGSGARIVLAAFAVGQAVVAWFAFTLALTP